MLHFYFKNVNREKKIRENVAELVVDIQERPWTVRNEEEEDII